MVDDLYAFGGVVRVGFANDEKGILGFRNLNKF